MRDLDEACAIANRIAPEHLELAVADADALLPKSAHAGAIFIGHHRSEALGDYCAGPNHVLPTARTARFSSPLGVYDFQKRTSVHPISREGARTLGADRGDARTRRRPCRRTPQSAQYRSNHAMPCDESAELSQQRHPRRRFARFAAYHVARADGLVKLDAMENPYGLPEELRGADWRRSRAMRASTAIRMARRDGSRRALRAGACEHPGRAWS